MRLLINSFIFSMLNESMREKKIECIKNLGPFCVAISRLIDDIQRNSSDIREGEVNCFRGMALSNSLVEQWKTQKRLDIEGFASTSEVKSKALWFSK